MECVHYFVEQLCMLTVYNSSTVLNHRQEYIVKDEDAELWGKNVLSQTC